MENTFLKRVQRTSSIFSLKSELSFGFNTIPIASGKSALRQKISNFLAATATCGLLTIPAPIWADGVSSYSSFLRPSSHLAGLLTKHKTNNTNTINHQFLHLFGGVPSSPQQILLGQTRVFALDTSSLHGEVVRIEQLVNQGFNSEREVARFSIMFDTRSVRCRTQSVGTERVCFVASDRTGGRDTTCLTVTVVDTDQPNAALAATNDKIWIHTTFAADKESFKVEGIEQFPNNDLRIFDQSGAEIFRKHGYRNEWKGRADGDKKIPVGTYLYWLEDGEGHSMAGYVEVI